jgi:Double zinc ribbon
MPPKTLDIAELRALRRRILMRQLEYSSTIAPIVSSVPIAIQSRARGTNTAARKGTPNAPDSRSRGHRFWVGDGSAETSASAGCYMDGCGCRRYKCLVVTCPRCGASRGDGDRFCADCGAPLGRCPSCGEPASQGHRFCPACGYALAGVSPAPLVTGSASSPAGTAGPMAERRVCSVLFCDVVGFTPLSEARDPEAVRELLSR